MSDDNNFHKMTDYNPNQCFICENIPMHCKTQNIVEN